MSYLALARKWRPRTFADLVGQGHVVRALSNALADDRLHPALLLTGTRGVGKTTIARIVAKALNCERGVSATPCESCSSCIAVDQGRFVDLIEVDAASRTGVDDTRDLLDNVPYAPGVGRYKVYLIDEVHMFSRNSFNALLKTLEEPPPHVKFLLATTDPQRLPVTVLSRCLQFSLKRLSSEQIGQRLAQIVAAEGITTDDEALRQLARAGDGSLRDALSLLDQAIAFGDGKLVGAEVSAMLGTVDRGQIVALLTALAAADAQQVLDIIAELDCQAPDYSAVAVEMLDVLKQVGLIQYLPGKRNVSDDTAALNELVTALTPEDVQLFYQILLQGQRDLSLVPEPRSGFEMLLLRLLCFKPVAISSSTATTALPTVSSSSQRHPVASQGPSVNVQTSPQIPADPPVKTTQVSPLAITVVPPTPAVPDTRPAKNPEPGQEPWNQVVPRLGLSGFPFQLALHCVLGAVASDHLELILEPGFTLRTQSSEDRLREALEQYYGRSLRLQFSVGSSDQETPAQQQAAQRAERQRQAVEAIEGDPNVQVLQSRFAATVNPDSITPTDD